MTQEHVQDVLAPNTFVTVGATEHNLDEPYSNSL
jgi:hypothetical protein